MLANFGQKIPGYSRVFTANLGGYPGTRLTAGAQILGEYEVLLVPVTGISKPGNTREYPGNWQRVTPLATILLCHDVGLRNYVLTASRFGGK